MPVVATLGVSMAMGLLVALPFVTSSGPFSLDPLSFIVLGAFFIGAPTLSVAAAEATRPWRRRAIGAQVRRND